VSLQSETVIEGGLSQAFYRSILNSLHPGVVVYAPDMSVLTCNRRATEILGLSEDELRTLGTAGGGWKMYESDGTQCREHPGHAALRTGEPQLDRLRRLVFDNGEERWVLNDAMPMSDRGGSPTGVTLSFLDITARHRADEALAENDAFRSLAENSGDSVIVLDVEGCYVYASPAVIRTHGLSAEELVGKVAIAVVHPDDVAAVQGLRDRQFAGMAPESLEYRIRQPDGSYLWVEASASPLRDAAGEVTGLQVAIRDISERRAHQEALRRANEQFAQAFVHAPIGIALVATDGHWMQVNPALCDLLGYDQESLLTMTFQEITHPDDLKADMALVEDVLAGRRSSYQMRKRYICADGRIIWILLSVAVVLDDEGRPSHFVSQIQDVTERRLMEDRLREMADRDHLTGLLNRRRFEEELRRQLDRCDRHHERAALLILDLDDFKHVNDTGGHAAGDSVLRSFSHLITERVRGIDTVARLGGDEFGVILVDSDREGGLRVANSIVEAMRHTGPGGSGVTVSVGVTALDPSDEPDAALARADGAMYKVKHAGRDGAALDV
jgi:diguanylate cyclase (GGDEF)-like protein/PAS domain S-box-containing protein